MAQAALILKEPSGFAFASGGIDVETVKRNEGFTAVYPISDNELIAVHREPFHESMARPDLYELESGVAVRAAQVDERRQTHLRLQIESVNATPVRVDTLLVSDFKAADGRSLGALQSPPFIHGVQVPMDLKVPHMDASFPYASTLIDKHVTVMCCTGCNGGIHGRGFVVLNNHSGGGWSSIWVKTPKQLDVPYARWQRVMFAGGVLTELNGSTTVVDQGLMIVQMSDETAHHAPPALPVETNDLPAVGTESLIAKSLDAAWVQFSDLLLQRVRHVADEEIDEDDLPKTEVEFSDHSGGRSRAWLYQGGRMGLKESQKLSRLRGFVHAEKPGQYVLLSDKDEDLTF
jgi:hypothetical protein